MTAASQSPGSERHSSPCPPSPSSSATVTAASSPSTPTAPPKSRLFTLPPPHNRAQSHKIHRNRPWHDDGETSSGDSGTETQQDPDSLRTAYQRAFRRASERAMTMPSARTSKKPDRFRAVSPATARRAVSRRSPSPVSSASSSSPDRIVPSTSTAGIGRKVAASLDLFKETAPSPSIEKDEVDAFDLPRPESSNSKRRGGGPPVTQVGEAQFEFVKRSDWPDREAAAIRREKSTTGLERVRTRDSTSSVTSARDPDFRKRKERTLSRRETVLNDLVQWRAAVEAGREDDGRGRPRERSVWLEDTSTTDAISSGSEPSSVSSASTLHQEGRVTQSPVLALHPPSPPLTHSPAPESHRSLPTAEPPVSPLDLHQLPPPARRGLTRSRSPPPTHADAPLPLPGPSHYARAFDSPWSTDDDDDESAWDTASVTTTTSTTSASSPFPLSPSRTSPHPQPRVHNASDEDEERHHRAMLSSYDEIELSPSPLEGASSADIASNLDLYGLSQESLPHIPLRPFRNQVGGHSAIYKFTKRAVCKVSVESWLFAEYN